MSNQVLLVQFDGGDWHGQRQWAEFPEYMPAHEQEVFVFGLPEQVRAYGQRIWVQKKSYYRRVERIDSDAQLFVFARASMVPAPGPWDAAKGEFVVDEGRADAGISLADKIWGPEEDERR